MTESFFSVSTNNNAFVWQENTRIDAESLAKTQLIKTSLWVLLTNGTDPSLKYKKNPGIYLAQLFPF